MFYLILHNLKVHLIQFLAIASVLIPSKLAIVISFPLIAYTLFIECVDYDKIESAKEKNHALHLKHPKLVPEIKVLLLVESFATLFDDTDNIFQS